MNDEQARKEMKRRWHERGALEILIERAEARHNVELVIALQGCAAKIDFELKLLRQELEENGSVEPFETGPGTSANEKSWASESATFLAHGPGPEAIKSRREAMRVPERLSDEDKTPTGPEAA